MSVTQAENAIHRRETIPERRLFHIMLVLAIITTVLSSVVAVYEISTFPKPDPEKKNPDGTQVLPVTLKPPVPPLVMLPEQVLRYATKGRQELPGSQYPAAEAVYEILDENIMLSDPISTYAKVTYFPSQEAAERDIRETLTKRYPKNQEDLLFGNTIAKAGYDAREGSYFVGWTMQTYSLKTYTSFLDHVPVEKETRLRDHAVPLVKELASSAKINKEDE